MDFQGFLVGSITTTGGENHALGPALPISLINLSSNQTVDTAFNKEWFPFIQLLWFFQTNSLLIYRYSG